MKRWLPSVILIASLLLLVHVPGLVMGQNGVMAEAVGQANLRAEPSTDAALMGEIRAGTRYPVIGRSEFFPWVLLGDPVTQQPIGWVFRDLLTIYGDLNQVPISTLNVNTPFVPPAATSPAGAQTGPTLPAVTPSPTPNFTVVGIVNGEINIRYGPGVEYPRIGVVNAGERLEVTAYHTQYPWVQIRFAASPTGYAWVAAELLQFEGDRFSLPAISQTSFANQPTLTPVPLPIFSSVIPGEEPVPLSPAFEALGRELWAIFVNGGFDPATSRFGSLYLHDLQTGEALTFGNDIAFSGTSINKIAILADVFSVLDTPPRPEVAVDIANTMICSENVATNRLLGIVGNGDQLAGADHVTSFLQQMGLENTFIAAPFDTTNPLVTATPIPRAPNIPVTNADRTRANPDFVNQMTVDEMGWLIGSIYQCAFENRGPLMTNFPGLYTPQECRTMLHVMNSNTVDGLLRAGVPEDIPVAHKHGWIADTHGNAALFFTPGGNYVLVAMLYQPGFLIFGESLPVIAEASRTVYNYFNPGQPMLEIREGFIPEAASCNFAGDPLIAEIGSPAFDPPFGPISTPDVPAPESTPDSDSS